MSVLGGSPFSASQPGSVFSDQQQTYPTAQSAPFQSPLSVVQSPRFTAPSLSQPQFSPTPFQQALPQSAPSQQFATPASFIPGSVSPRRTPQQSFTTQVPISPVRQFTPTGTTQVPFSVQSPVRQFSPQQAQTVEDLTPPELQDLAAHGQLTTTIVAQLTPDQQ